MAGAKSFNQLFLSLRGSLARSVVGIVPPREIEDIVQEAYVRVCRIEKKATNRTPQSYLLRAVRNLALDYIKRSESRLTDSLEGDADTAIPAVERLADETFNQVATSEEFALFCDAVRHLPVQCRCAFVLKKVYGYSQREIAEELGLSESTVEKRIALGIKRCTYFMQKFEQKQPRGGLHEPRDIDRDLTVSDLLLMGFHWVTASERNILCQECGNNWPIERLWKIHGHVAPNRRRMRVPTK
jgi:RNA polymerase sigma-70 factor (ECF subfamily)